MVVKLELCIFASFKIGIRSTGKRSQDGRQAGRICLFVALLMTITLVVRIIVHASAFNCLYIDNIEYFDQ